MPCIPDLSRSQGIIFPSPRIQFSTGTRGIDVKREGLPPPDLMLLCLIPSGLMEIVTVS